MTTVGNGEQDLIMEREPEKWLLYKKNAEAIQLNYQNPTA